MDAAISSRQGIRSQRQRQANLGRLERSPDSRGMRSNQIQLQFLDLCRLDLDPTKSTETGIDAITRLGGRCSLDHRSGGRLDPLAGQAGQSKGRLACGNRCQILPCEGTAVETDLPSLLSGESLVLR